MPIHHLHEPIDVFSEWLDDCEAAERGEIAAAVPGQKRKEDMRTAVHDTSRDYDDDEEEDDLPEASVFGKKKAAAAGGKADGGSEGGIGLGLDDSDDDDSDG